MGRLIPCLILAACSAEPTWVLVEKNPKTSTYVDTRSLRKEGKLLHATVRAVMHETTTVAGGPPPQYSTITMLSVDCAGKSVRVVSHEMLSHGQSIIKHGMPDVFQSYSNWDSADPLPRRLCEHVNNGRALAR